MAALMSKSAPEAGKPRGLASAFDSRLAECGVVIAELRFVDSTEGTSVKVALSSGVCWQNFPLSAIPAVSGS